MTKKLLLALLGLFIGGQAMAQYGNYRYDYQSYFPPDKDIRLGIISTILRLMLMLG